MGIFNKATVIAIYILFAKLQNASELGCLVTYVDIERGYATKTRTVVATPSSYSVVKVVYMGV